MVYLHFVHLYGKCRSVNIPFVPWDPPRCFSVGILVTLITRFPILVAVEMIPFEVLEMLGCMYGNYI